MVFGNGCFSFLSVLFKIYFMEIILVIWTMIKPKVIRTTYSYLKLFSNNLTGIEMLGIVPDRTVNKKLAL